MNADTHNSFFTSAEFWRAFAYGFSKVLMGRRLCSLRLW